MPYSIFVINPGSTSTKLALVKGGANLFDRTIRHNPEELKRFPRAADQLEYRFEAINRIIVEECVQLGDVDAYAGRGGFLRPLKGGTYIVNQSMLADLANSRYGDHASNLGAIIAARLSEKYEKTAYIVNPPVVDELMDEARFTGLPELSRISAFHALNQKAAAMHAAEEAGIEYDNGRFIVAHLGGGISIGAHDHGCVVDVNNALEEGPFTPERAGSLPSVQLAELCFSGRYTREEVKRMLIGRGGLFAYTGTTDCIMLEKEAQTDEKTGKLLDAMIYRISREICASAAAVCGRIDRIVITGGLANSSYIVEGIRKRVSFLGPLAVYPGELKMIALAEGVTRVLEGKEKVLEY